MNLPALSLEEARRDVRARAEALGDAELALETVRGCSVLIHPTPVLDCPRCETWRAAWLRVISADNALSAAIARLEAVESQQRDPQWIGGER